MEVRIAATSYVGDQRFCRMSRQSSPFAYTFGWNMRERNLTEGGLFGYDSSKVSTSLKVPSSKGVSAAGECVFSSQAGWKESKRRRTWAKDYCVPEHDVIGTWAARDPARRVGRETLEVADEAALAVGRLSEVNQRCSLRMWRDIPSSREWQREEDDKSNAKKGLCCRLVWLFPSS
jgi:hypothetical protein